MNQFKKGDIFEGMGYHKDSEFVYTGIKNIFEYKGRRICYTQNF